MDHKKRIKERTMLRRKYNSVIDKMAFIPEHAKTEMQRKPYEVRDGHKQADRST